VEVWNDEHEIQEEVPEMLVADGDHDPLKNSLLVEVETHEDRRVGIYPYDEAAVEVRRDHEIEEDSDETDDDVDVEGA